MNALHILWLLVNDAFFAAIPAVGFALLFDVTPVRWSTRRVPRYKCCT